MHPASGHECAVNGSDAVCIYIKNMVGGWIGRVSTQVEIRVVSHIDNSLFVLSLIHIYPDGLSEIWQR